MENEKKPTVGKVFAPSFIWLLAGLYLMSSFGAWQWSPMAWPEWLRYIDAILVIIGGIVLYVALENIYGDF